MLTLAVPLSPHSSPTVYNVMKNTRVARLFKEQAVALNTGRVDYQDLMDAIADQNRPYESIVQPLAQYLEDLYLMGAEVKPCPGVLSPEVAQTMQAAINQAVAEQTARKKPTLPWLTPLTTGFFVNGLDTLAVVRRLAAVGPDLDSRLQAKGLPVLRLSLVAAVQELRRQTQSVEVYRITEEARVDLGTDPGTYQVRLQRAFAPHKDAQAGRQSRTRGVKRSEEEVDKLAVAFAKNVTTRLRSRSRSPLTNEKEPASSDL